MKGQFCFCLLVMIVAVSPALYSKEEAKPPETLEQLKRAIRDTLESCNIPGAGIALVSSDSVIWAGGIGKADVAADKAATGETLFRVGSISKSFVSIAVLMLQERGLINLNDKLRDLAPEIEYENRWEETHPVRIVHLLEHTTGFDDIHFNEYVHNKDPYISTFEGLAYNPNSRKARWEPGMFMSYCNSGPSIAAYVLEKITGECFEDFVSENIFDVLGMNASSFHYPDTAKYHFSKGYEGDELKEARYDHIIMRPSGSLNSSAVEMAYFVQMLLNRGSFNGRSLLEPASINRMETPQSTLAARSGLNYGYGLGNSYSADNCFIFHGHSGAITGFMASYGYLIKQGLGYVVLLNKPHISSLRDITKLIRAYLTRELEKPAPPEIELSGDNLQSLTGYYQAFTSRLQITRFLERLLNVKKVYLEEDKLYQKPLFEKKKQLIPVAENFFRTENQPDASTIFVKDGKGSLLWLGGENFKKVATWSIFLQLSVAVLSIVLMISSILFALIWLPMKLFGKLKKVMYLHVRIIPLVAVVCLVTAILVFSFSSDFIQDFGNFTPRSFVFFILTLCFAVLSLAGLVLAVRSFSLGMNRLVRIHSLLVSIANTTVLLYLWYWGIIGLRTWA